MSSTNYVAKLMRKKCSTLHLLRSSKIKLRKSPITQPPNKVSINSFGMFFARVRAVCIQNFSSLVLKLWVEFEVKDGKNSKLIQVFIQHEQSEWRDKKINTGVIFLCISSIRVCVRNLKLLPQFGS